MRDEMTKLIERLEKATGPDRELDLAIQMMLGRQYAMHHDVPVAEWSTGNVPPYTASLDAALTLVPDRWTAWELASRRRMTRFACEISRLDEASQEQYANGHGSTSALAFCIAALRACAPEA